MSEVDPMVPYPYLGVSALAERAEEEEESKYLNINL